MNYRLCSLSCIVCETTTKTVCGDCLAMPYCSIECQIIDWPKHKILCKSKIPLNYLRINKTHEEREQESSEDKLLVKECKQTVDKSFELLTDNEFHSEDEVVTDTSIVLNVLPSSKKIFTIDDLEIIDLRVGKNVQVIVIDTVFLESGIVFVMDSEKQSRYTLNENLTTLSKFCNKYAAKMRCYTPKLNELFLVKFNYDKQWYRAFCIKELDNNNFLVQFVDFGNVITISKNDIIPMHEELMFPSCTHMIRIINIQSVNYGKFQRYIEQRPRIYADMYFDEKLGVYCMIIRNLESMLE